ncbi:hypothetical protein [Leifsonia sp. 2MCAF36]|uniref:hypothetical protein n=1 Tax=Leifsonia sp. 2MCAF36 TaxID=3232988 RepID=UPI003F954370
MRNVTAATTFDGHHWMFIIHELGAVGQANHRSDIPTTVREVAALWLDADPKAVNVGRIRYLRRHWSRLVP